MKIKPGVQMAGLKPVMRSALIAADEIWKSLGYELVVTSALDGDHSAGSLHYYGYALDFRINYFNPKQRQQAYNSLCHALGRQDYIVVLEPDHIHVQFNGGVV